MLNVTSCGHTIVIVNNNNNAFNAEVNTDGNISSNLILFYFIKLVGSDD